MDKTPVSVITLKKNKIIVRKEVIDLSIPKLFWTSLRTLLIHQAHHSILAGHREERRLYDSLQQDYYWPNMVMDDDNIANSCNQCPRMGVKFKYQRQLELFPPAGVL